MAGVLVSGGRDAHGRARAARYPRVARTPPTPVMSPRTTRLVRAADLRSFRNALVALATDGSPLDARNRLVIVPTRAASLHLVRTIEDRMSARGAIILPDFITRGELHQRLFDRIDVCTD